MDKKSFFPSYAKIDEKYSDLFLNYDKQKLDSVVIRLSNDLENPENIKLAGRLIIFEVVKSTGKLSNYLETFEKRLAKSVYDFLKMHIIEFQQFIDEKDYLNYNDQNVFSASTFVKSYLLKNNYKDFPSETPLLMYLRIAVYLYWDSIKSNLTIKNKVIEMANKYYTPASPTLFNVGTVESQGSSCFLGTLTDNLDNILNTGIHDMGMISKGKGGIGLCLSKLRHSEISHGGMSTGITPFARVLEKLILYVDQTGSRSGAATIHLHCWHIDLMDFVNLTNNVGQSHSNVLSFLNTCIWVPDLFMRRAAEKKPWYVFCPAKASKLYGSYGKEFETYYQEYEIECELAELKYLEIKNKYEEIKIRIIQETDLTVLEELYKEKILIMKDLKIKEKQRITFIKYDDASVILKHFSTIQIRSGMPYIMYGDNINAKSNQINFGKVNGSNLCVEIVEVSDEHKIATCNLSSISLKSYVEFDYYHGIKLPYFNFDKLGEMVKSVVENLNKIIDKNFYPVDQKTKKYNFDSRPLGIGVSGFDDAVKMLDLVFESKEADELNKKIFACMYYNALEKSNELAIENESYSYFKTGSFELESVFGPEEIKYKSFKSFKFEPVFADANTGSNDTKIYTYTFEGSPFYNEILQFDLWKESSLVKKARGNLDESVYKLENDVALEPSSWSKTTTDKTWDSLKKKIRETGIFNSMLLTCMPTASTAQILNNAESTEVHTSNLYCRTVNSGNFIVLNEYLVSDLKEIGLFDSNTIDYLKIKKGSIQGYDDFLERYDKISVEMKSNFIKHKAKLNHIIKKYKTMFEIKQMDILNKARDRGIYIDQSQSTNVYIKQPTPNIMMAVHRHSNKLGLKTGMYYLRQEDPRINQSFGFGVSPSLIKFFDVSLTPIVEEIVVDGPVCRMDADCLSCGS